MVVATTIMMIVKKKKYDWKGRTCVIINLSLLALGHCTVMKAFKGMMGFKTALFWTIV